MEPRSWISSATPSIIETVEWKPPIGIALLCLFMTGAGLFATYIGNRLLGEGRVGVLFGSGAFLLALLYFVAVYGLWNKRVWGYRLALLNYGIPAVVYLLTLNVLGLLVDGLLLYYLYTQRHHYL